MCPCYSDTDSRTLSRAQPRGNAKTRPGLVNETIPKRATGTPGSHQASEAPELSGDAVHPLLARELRFAALPCDLKVFVGDGADRGVVLLLEVVEERLKDFLTGKAGLGTHGVHALNGAAGALVADLLHADAQDLVHLDGVDVVGHGHVVDHVAVRPALLRGTADLSELGGDVVERHVRGLDAQLVEDLHDPLIEVWVCLLEAHSLHEGGGDDERVGDAVAGLHEHGTAAGDAPRHGEAAPRDPAPQALRAWEEVGLVPGAYVVVLASEAGGIVVSLEDGQMVHIEDTQASGIIVRG